MGPSPICLLSRLLTLLVSHHLVFLLLWLHSCKPHPALVSPDQISSDQAQHCGQALDGRAPHETGDYLAGSPAENSLCARADLQKLQHYQTSNFYFVFCFASTLVSSAARVAWTTVGFLYSWDPASRWPGLLDMVMAKSALFTSSIALLSVLGFFMLTS